MKKFDRITEIIKIEPFKITCRWTTGEIRVIDFTNEFEKWKKNNSPFLTELVNYEKFQNVTVKDGTLLWYSVNVFFTGLDGKQNHQPLDIDPESLYSLSKPISHYRLVLNNSITEDKYVVV